MNFYYLKSCFWVLAGSLFAIYVGGCEESNHRPVWRAEAALAIAEAEQPIENEVEMPPGWPGLEQPETPGVSVMKIPPWRRT